MNKAARRSLWLALAFSIFMHLGVLTSPGWGLPGLDDEPADEHLDARLVTPVPPPPRPAPVAKPRPRPPTPVPIAPSPTEDALSPTVAPVAESVTASAEPAVAPAPTFASDMVRRWPRRGRIVFQVTRGEGGLLVGESTHIWSHDGVRYELRVVTETVGLAALFRPAKVEQVSRGEFDALGLRPEAFETRRNGELKESARFDTAAGRIVLGNGGSAALPPGAQDLISMFHQLGGLPPEAAEQRIVIATGRKAPEYRVALVGLEALVVPLGEFRTRHYRIGEENAEDATDIWIDVQTGLPIRIRHKDRKGEVFDQPATLIDTKDTP